MEYLFKKSPPVLNTPARLMLAVVSVLLVADFMIVFLIESIDTTILKDEVLKKWLFEFIAPIALSAIVSLALYLLIFKPMTVKRAELERQLDELGRLQTVTVGRELRMKELTAEISLLRNPLAVEKAGNRRSWTGSPEYPPPAAGEFATQSMEESQCSALLFMLEDVVAERNKIERAHQEWLAALDVETDPICLHDQQFRILRCNKAYQQCAGPPFQDIIGQPYYAVFPKSAAPLSQCLRSPETAENSPASDVTVGNAIYRSRAFPIHDQQGAYLYSVFTLVDITQRKPVEDALKESERIKSELLDRLNETQRLAMIGSWEWDLQTDQLWWSDETYRIFGVTRQDYVPSVEANRKFIHPDDVAMYDESFGHCIQSGEQLDLKFRLVANDDGLKYCHVRAELTYDDSGRQIRFAGTIMDITERSLVEDALRQSEQQFRTLADALPQIVWITTPDGWNIYHNQHWVDFTGLTLEESYGHGWCTPIHPDDQQRVWDAWQRAIQTDSVYSLECRLRRADGVYRWWLILGVSLHDANGKIVNWFGTCTDIQYIKESEEKLRLAASVFTHAREGIMITAADGAIVDVNDAFSDITGYSRDEVLGQNPRLLKSGIHDAEFYTAMWRDMIEKGYWHGELWNRHKNGDVIALMPTFSAVRDEQGNTFQYVALYSDITQLKEHEQKLERSAHYDVLTSLPNRVLLADRLQQCMAQVRRRKQRLAVAFLDLDGFKTINDNYGHDAGDQLLITLATRMKQVLREGDTLARLGGDEFVAVLADIGDIEACVPMLNRLLTSAAEPVPSGDLSFQVSASLGVTFYPQHEDINADQLIRQADQAMYQAKQAGKNRFHFFDAEQDRSIRGRYESLERIRHALASGEFVLYYQPKVNMREGRVSGAEALIRWQHPEKGLLMPDLFLPEIEDHALAIAIGEWVIDTALAQMEIWQATGLNIPVSVNIGSRHMQQLDFVERLRALLAAHPTVCPADLGLEVRETYAMSDLTKVSWVIDACRKMGVNFALDDFGTGYSSITYLRHLPVAQLKIDQSFVRDMIDNPNDLSIVEGVIGLATAFRLLVVAEGAETSEHSKILLQLGCDLAQGYGIAHPMPASQLPGWEENWRPDPTWINLSTISRDELPLLFAIAEHRAWIIAMEKYLNGERETPPQQDINKCRFGQWLNTEGLARFGALPSFEAIDLLHRQVHALAAEQCLLQAQGRKQEALARLGELHGLRDSLLEQLMLARQKSLTSSNMNLDSRPAIELNLCKI